MDLRQEANCFVWRGEDNEVPAERLLMNARRMRIVIRWIDVMMMDVIQTDVMT